MPFIQAKSVQGTATSITTPSFTSTSGHFLAVGVGNGSITPSGSPVTDNKGNTFANAWIGAAGSSGSRAACYYAENITGGASHTVTYAPGGNIACVLGVAEFDDVVASSSLDQTATATKAIPGPTLQNHTSGLTAQTTQATELLIGVGSDDLPGTVPASFEAFQDVVALGDTGPEGVTLGFLIVHAIGTYSYSVNNGSCGLATFKTGANPMFVQSKSAQGNSVTTITTAAFTSTAGNFLATVVSDFNRTITGTPVSDSKGNTYQQGFAPQNTGIHRVGNYYAENITGGASHTVTYALAGSGFSGLAVAEFSGVNTSSTLDQSVSANATSVTLGGATAQADELLIGGIGNGNNGNPFGSTGQYAATFTDDIAVQGTSAGLILSHLYVTQQNKYAFSSKNNNNQTVPTGIATFKLVLAATGSGDITVSPDQIDGSGTTTPPPLSGTGNVTAGPDQITGSGTAVAPLVTGSGGIIIGADQIDGYGPADADVTAVVVEAFGGATPVAYVTETGVEIFGGAPVDAYITETVIEVFGIAAPPFVGPDPYGEVEGGDAPTAGTSMCGSKTPLFYCELKKDSGSIFYSWVDQPLNDPTSQKLPRIIDVSTLRRAFGDWTGRLDIAHGTVTLWDGAGDIRTLIRSNTLIRKQIDFYFIDDVNRRAGVAPLRVGSYLINDYDVVGDMTVVLSFEGRMGGEAADFTLQKKVPYRTFDGATFPQLPRGMSGKREPIPYGIIPQQDYPGPEADEISLEFPFSFGALEITYVGQETLPDGRDYYAGVIAGCATWGVLKTFATNGVIPATGFNTSGGLTAPVPVRILMPESKYDSVICCARHGSLWTTNFGTTLYRVYNGKRYTMIYFLVGSVEGEAFKNSAVAPTPVDNTVFDTTPPQVDLGGIEEIGDCTGRVITSLPRQKLHFDTNFVVQNHATDANWYAIPTTGTPPYAVIDADSYEAVHTAAVARIAGDTLYTPGVGSTEYQGQWVVGWDREPITIGDQEQRLCLAGDFSQGTDRHGRERLSMEDTSAASVKDFTIVPNILKDSYVEKKDRTLLANRITAWTYKFMSSLLPAQTPVSTFTGQKDWASSELGTSFSAAPVSDATSIADLGGEPGGEREFHYEDWATRDITLNTPNNVMRHMLARRKDGPTFITIKTDLCGFDVDLGDVYTVTHFAGLHSTTRRLRCVSVSLDPPNPFTKNFGVTLVGYDITDL